MSDVMLHGVLNMPLPDDPSECDLVTWMQFKDRAREASAQIEALTAERDALAGELRRLREAIADKGGSESYPTEWAYLKACEVMHKAKAERDALKAKLEKVVCFVTEIEAGPSWGDSLPIWVNAQMLKARAIFAELKGQDDE